MPLDGSHGAGSAGDATMKVKHAADLLSIAARTAHIQSCLSFAQPGSAESLQ